MKRVGIFTNDRDFLEGVYKYRLKEAREFWCIPLITDYSTPFDSEFVASLELDGILLLVVNHAVEKKVLESGIHAVNVMSGTLDYAIPTVCRDNARIGALAANHLIEKGAEHFCYVEVSRKSYSHPRFSSFAKALESQGHSCQRLTVSPKKRELRIQGLSANPSSLIPSLLAIKKPAGIFAENDHTGFVVIEACRMAGIRVPEEICVLGTNNQPEFCHLASPELSSIDLNSFEHGYQSARVLDLLMAGDAVDNLTVVSANGIVQRASTDILPNTDPKVAEALQFIRSNVSQNINVSDVVKRLVISKRSLQYKFHKHLGKTVRDVIREHRLELAKQYLTQTAWTIERVSLEAGFPNINSLMKSLKREAGLTPKRFREEHNVS